MAEKNKSLEKVASIKTVKKWEIEFSSQFSYDTKDGKVFRLRCFECTKWELKIKTATNFSTTWIRPGSDSVAKDSVAKHCRSDQHKKALEHTKRSLLGAEVYKESVVMNSPIAKSFLKLSPDYRAGLKVKINTVYHIIKNEDPYTNYPKLLELQTKNNVPELANSKTIKSYATDDAGALFGDFIGTFNLENLKKDLGKIHYYSVLTDGSTDSSVTKQEAIYILFLHDGIPKVRYFSVESISNANAAGIHEGIKTAFERFGITNFSDRIVGLNADGASVNMGEYRGLGKLVKESAPWLELVHCFNHRIELALKDAFDTSPFGKIVDMLTKLYYLYQKSPTRYRELRELSEVYEKSIPKPTKACGTRWIDHKYRAMQKVLQNYGAYMVHLESLSQTDSQAFKRAEIQGSLKKWKHASYPIYMSVYLDVLAPIRRISLAMQQDLHDPVKVTRRIKEFTWTMAKLVLVFEQALDDDNILTHYTKFLGEVEVDNDGKHVYQNVKLKQYNRTKNRVKQHYKETVDGSFGNTMIADIVLHFHELLVKNNCHVEKIQSEWLVLKGYLIPMIMNDKKSKYLDLWSRVFQNDEVKEECKNILHIFEIMLVVPFTNAKVERVFSRMKTDVRNRLKRDRLDVYLRVGDDGMSVKDFNPDPIIDLWFKDKVRRLNSGPHKYGKRKKSSDGSRIDLSTLTLSDLESDADE